MKKLVLFALLAAAGSALLLTLSAAAQAKLAPVEAPAGSVSPNDLAISTGAAGAMLEQNYFQAPSSGEATKRVLRCRLQTRIFDKTPFAQSQWCRR